MAGSPLYHIAHIDLKDVDIFDWQKLQAAPCYIVCWWDEIPLGHFFSTEITMPSSLQDWRKIIRAAVYPALNYYAISSKQQLPDETSWINNNISNWNSTFEQIFIKKEQSYLPAVSVIICTRNRTVHLKNCLLAIQQLNHLPAEILVVDNAPDNNDTADLVKEFTAVKYILEPRAGLDHARNAGIKNATSDIIAFTDDDVVLHSEWVYEIARSFSDPFVQATTGLIIAGELQTNAQYLFEKFWSFNRGYIPIKYDSQYFREHKEKGVPVWEIGAGANMAFRRKIFDALGLFDIRLDMGAAGCNGDSEMWYRILAEGWSIQYNPLIIAYHTHRHDLSAFKKQIFQYLRGFTTAVLLQYDRYKNKGELYHLFQVLPPYYCKNLLVGLKNGFHAQYTTVLPEIKGYIAGLGYYLKHKKETAFDITYQQPFPTSEIIASPSVSVIITTYNDSKFLPDSIQSVLQQTYPNIELIIIDDGSTDDTKELIKNYPQAKYVYQQNQGLAAARNTGATVASGDFLTFLDADDWLYPNAININLKYFRQHPEAAFVSGNHDKVDMHKRVLLSYESVAPEKDFYQSLLQGNYIGMHATVLYRKEVFTYFRYDINLKACEDYDLYLRIARAFLIFSHNEKVAAYRFHGHNMSNNILMMMQQIKWVLQKHYRCLPVPAKYPLYKKGLRVWKTYYAREVIRRLLYRDFYAYYRPNLKDTFFAIYNLPFATLKSLTKIASKKIYNSSKKLIPAFMKRKMYEAGYINEYKPAIGKIKFGDLNRIFPVSQQFGFDRGVPVDRFYIENFIRENSDDIQGKVLEIKDNNYTNLFGKNISKSDVLDIDPDNTKATIIGDLCQLSGQPDEQYDCIILVQTLQYIYHYKDALQTCFRLLKRGGILLLTVPGISTTDFDQIHSPWFHTFTGTSVKYMLEELFDTEKIIVKSYGNVLMATAFLQGLAQDEIKHPQKYLNDPHYPVAITAKAIK